MEGRIDSMVAQGPDVLPPLAMRSPEVAPYENL